MVDYNSIFEHNRKWAAEMKKENPRFFEKHFSAQNPDFLYIGCSDSRVSVEKLMGVDIGEVFVHRNIANIVSPEDANAMAVIQFAVEVLKVKNIVVAGHTGCGGIKASLIEKSQGAMDQWLQKIKNVYFKHEDYLKSIDNENYMLDEFSRFNVMEQCKTITELPCVKESVEKTGYPIVHAWLYEMKDGHLVDLEF